MGTYDDAVAKGLRWAAKASQARDAARAEVERLRPGFEGELRAAADALTAAGAPTQRVVTGGGDSEGWTLHMEGIQEPWYLLPSGAVWFLGPGNVPTQLKLEAAPDSDWIGNSERGTFFPTNVRGLVARDGMLAFDIALGGASVEKRLAKAVTELCRTMLGR